MSLRHLRFFSNITKALIANIYKTTTVFIIVVCFLLLPKVGFLPAGAEGFSVIRNILFPLSHANIFHLALNILCICYLKNAKRYVIPAVIVSFLCSLLPEPNYSMEPGIMGASGILFAIVGFKYGIYGKGALMVRNNWLFFLVSAFMPNVAMLYHLYCITIAYALAWVYQTVILWQRCFVR